MQDELDNEPAEEDETPMPAGGDTSEAVVGTGDSPSGDGEDDEVVPADDDETSALGNEEE